MTTVDAPTRPGPRRPAPTPRHRVAYATRGSAAVAVAPAPAPAPAPRRARPQRRPDHLRVVRPGDRRRPRLTMAAGVAATAALFTLLFAVAIAHTVLVQGQVRLDDLDAQLATEQARYQDLRQEVAALESPTRIVAAAQAQGMVTPADLVYLQPPTPAPTTVGSAAGDDHEPDAAPAAGEREDQAWSTIKPLLESTAP